ncbi:glutathione S-transferase family protein [Faunimonas sp. B44]|uniref:glutathione S-transferase family protein n=1 Tax=Faunimonas sp. B44 TaxID=3461493 RepID=UPI00404404E6
MLTLYHYDRSTAAQRVRLALEEKEIPWESIVVDTARGDVEALPDEYHRLNPKGLVPVIIRDGKAIPESLVILEYLEDVFPERPFRPDAPEDRARMRLWMRRIDEGIHVASRVLGVCIVNRHIYREKGEEKIGKYYASMKDEVRKTNDQLNIERGLDSPLLPGAVTAFRKLFEEMDAFLAENRWLAGDSYSLADMALVVYVRRLESFMMAPLWSDLSRLEEWYRRIEARPAYQRAVVAWGDVTEAKRKAHGTEAFPRIAALWRGSEERTVA